MLSGTPLEGLVSQTWEENGFAVYDIPDLEAFREVFDAERRNF